MRKRILFSVAFCWIAFNSFSQKQDTLRYFDFEAISSSDTLIIEDQGPLKHGIGLYNGEKSTYKINAGGKVGNSLAFDGVANALAVSITGAAATSLGHPYYSDSLIGTQQNEFTAAMWVKTSNNIAQGWQQIWALGDGEGFFVYLKNNYLTYDAVTLASDDPYNFYFTRTTATVKVKWTFGSGWNHIATVFDKGALRLYVNNKLVGQDTLRGWVSKADITNPKVVIKEVIHSFLGSYEGISVGGGYGWKPYDIGATSGWMKFSNFFKGSIDEMRFYNYVLDSAAIAALPGNPSGSSVGVSQIRSTPEMLVYPNPSKGKVTVQLNNRLNKNKILEIYNSLGAKVSVVPFASDKTSIDMSGFNEGVYIFKITEGSNATIRKVILKK